LWRPFRFAVEYACLRACAAIAAFMPRRAWLWCGALLGDGLYVLRIYRQTVRKNMAFVGLWSADQQRRVTRRLYRNMGRYAAELLRPNGALPPAVIDGEGTLRRQMLGGQGGIVLFAHLGNWEVLPALLQRADCPVAIIAKPMQNPLVERWIRRHRQQVGVSFAAPAAALRQCLRVIRSHGLVALAIDQYPGRRGTPSTFLGRVTRTVRTSAGLALHTGCPVVGVYALLGADGTYRVSVQAIPPAVRPAAAGSDPVTDTLQAHNEAVSSWVTAHPDHWFGWFHRRFRDVVDY
jgi:KDO2-lipid IV(A) lauroyltransferase